MVNRRFAHAQDMMAGNFQTDKQIVVCSLEQSQTVGRKDLHYAREILIGKRISGVIFGFELSLILGEANESRVPRIDEGNAFLNLGARWKIVASNTRVGNNDHSCELLSIDKQLSLLYSCWQETIVEVDISTDAPTLMLYLSNSNVIVCDGFDERYETWSFGFRSSDGNKQIEVFVMPGGDIALMELP